MDVDGRRLYLVPAQPGQVLTDEDAAAMVGKTPVLKTTNVTPDGVTATEESFLVVAARLVDDEGTAILLALEPQ